MARIVDEVERAEIQKQINSEPELWHTTWEAFPPTVKIQNEIFPRDHEVYNCTTCVHNKKEDPVFKMNHPEEYRILCGPQGFAPGHWNEARRWNDIACPDHRFKNKRPKHGFMPGIESGKYDRLDRR